MLFARYFHFKERNASEKCVLRSLVPKHILRAMTSSAVTGIVGIQTTGINGIRDILAKN